MVLPSVDTSARKGRITMQARLLVTRGGARIAIAASLLASSSACIFMDHQITRPYMPAFKAHAPGEEIPLKISVEVHMRAHQGFNPAKVGVKRNGYGHDTADVLMEPSPEPWLQKGLEAELERVGFSVVQQGGNADVALLLEVEQFFVEPGVSAFGIDTVGLLAAEVEVKIPRTGAHLARLFVGVNQSTKLAVMASSLEDALLKAAHSCFRDVVIRLLELLEQQGVLT